MWRNISVLLLTFLCFYFISLWGHLWTIEFSIYRMSLLQVPTTVVFYCYSVNIITEKLELNLCFKTLIALKTSEGNAEDLNGWGMFSDGVFIWQIQESISPLAAEEVTGCKLFGKYLSWAADTIFPSHCFLEKDFFFYFIIIIVIDIFITILVII